MLELILPLYPTLPRLQANPRLFPLPLQATLRTGTAAEVWTMPRLGASLPNWDSNQASTPLELGTAMAL
jgi:hypothetical protein